MRRRLALLWVAAGCAGAPYSQPRVVYGGGASGDTAQAAAPEESFTGEVVASLGLASGHVASSPPIVVNSAVHAQNAEMIVVEGWLRANVDEVDVAAEALRARVTTDGGRVISDEIAGAGKGPTAGTIKVRLPPAKVDDFVKFVEGLGVIDYRRIQGTDVSKEYHDQAIALGNQRLTLGRLEKLLDNANLDTKSVLEIEKEMTRVRGQIEQLEGAQRFLADRAAMATLDISLTRRRGAEFGPEAKFHPGVRGSYLFNINGDGGVNSARPGIGFNLHISRAFSLDLDFYPTYQGRDLVVISTLGGSVYSDFLGGGERTFLNPYLGLRMGVAGADGAKFVVGGEIGLAGLFKHHAVLVETYARTLGLIGDGSQAVLQLGVGVSVPF